MLVMGILFIVLISVVKKGEETIEARARERLRLKEQLNRAEHLSSIGEMVAGVSHEIRNPLGTLRGFAQYFGGRTPEDPTATEYATLMVSEIDRLNRLYFAGRPDVVLRDYIANGLFPALAAPEIVDDFIETRLAETTDEPAELFEQIEMAEPGDQEDQEDQQDPETGGLAGNLGGLAAGALVGALGRSVA